MVTLYLALYAVISMLPTTCTRCHCCIQLVDMHQLYVLCISYVLMSSISILVQFFMVLYLQKQVCPQISRKFALSKHFPLYFVHQLCICCSLLHRLSLITGSPSSQALPSQRGRAWERGYMCCPCSFIFSIQYTQHKEENSFQRP